MIRSAIELSNHSAAMEFSGYIVAQTAGAVPGSMLQRPLTLVGSGSKLVRYYNMGPSYMFPGNSYSDGPTSRYAEIAKANAMIAAAEHVLWPVSNSISNAARASRPCLPLCPRATAGRLADWHRPPAQATAAARRRPLGRGVDPLKRPES
jgi:hypothetical protein